MNEAQSAKSTGKKITVHKMMSKGGKLILNGLIHIGMYIAEVFTHLSETSLAFQN